MSCQAARAWGDALSAFRKSSGSLCGNFSVAFFVIGGDIVSDHMIQHVAATLRRQYVVGPLVKRVRSPARVVGPLFHLAWIVVVIHAVGCARLPDNSHRSESFHLTDT